MNATEQKLVEKLEELVEATNKEVQLATGDLCIKDSEGFTYNVLAISQKITKLESEIAFLKQQIAEEAITDADIEAWAEKDYQKTAYNSYQHAFINGAKAMRNGNIKHIKNQ